jgi:hypothetical protein
MLVDPAERIQHCQRLPWISRALLAYIPKVHTFILICPKFTPSSSTTHYQLVVLGFAKRSTNIAAARPRIYHSQLRSIRTDAQHTLLCQKQPTILSSILKTPHPSVRSRRVLRTPHRTGMDMLEFAGRHSLPGKAWSGPRLAGSRMSRNRTGGSAHCRDRRHIVDSGRNRTQPSWQELVSEYVSERVERVGCG